MENPRPGPKRGCRTILSPNSSLYSTTCSNSAFSRARRGRLQQSYDAFRQVCFVLHNDRAESSGKAVEDLASCRRTAGRRCRSAINAHRLSAALMNSMQAGTLPDCSLLQLAAWLLMGKVRLMLSFSVNLAETLGVKRSCQLSPAVIRLHSCYHFGYSLHRACNLLWAKTAVVAQAHSKISVLTDT